MSYRVTLRNRQISFLVDDGETILQAAKRQGVTLPYGCSAGVCGVCMSQIVSGDVIYPDGQPLALFDEDIEALKMLYCQGVPVSDIVLEIPDDEDWEAWDSEDRDR